MRKRLGSSLVDYVIPTLVVGLALGTSLYYFYSNGTLKDFISASSKGDLTKQKGVMVLNDKASSINSPFNSFSPGALGGTESKPVKACDNSICTIDFGTYVVQGVPANWDSFVESTGTAGSTSKLTNILEQIYEDASTEACPKNASNCKKTQELKSLVELAKTMAQIQTNVETVAKACQQTSAPVTCLYTTLKSTPNDIDLTASAESILSDFNKKDKIADFSSDPFSNIYQQYPAFKENLSIYNSLSANQIDVSRYMQMSYSSLFNARKNSYPSYAMIDAYDKAMKSNSLTPSMKTNITNVFKELDKLNSDLSTKVYAAKISTLNTPNLGNVVYMDPVKGGVYYSGKATISNDLSDMISMKSSIPTEIQNLLCNNICSNK